MMSASSGRVRTTVRLSGNTLLMNRSAVLRTCGTATLISPSAVWIGRGRVPLREPVASGFRS